MSLVGSKHRAGSRLGKTGPYYPGSGGEAAILPRIGPPRGAWILTGRPCRAQGTIVKLAGMLERVHQPQG